VAHLLADEKVLKIFLSFIIMGVNQATPPHPWIFPKLKSEKGKTVKPH
jgi:hypothetical protein